MTKKFTEYFQKYKLTPRSQQTEVLQILEKEWDNYDYFLLSLPTGVR